MSLDALLSTVRAKACLAGPLAISGELWADGADSGTALSAMLAPASATVQALQAQGVVEGRLATLMADAAAVTAALGRPLRRGDSFRVASGSSAGTWVVVDGNQARGGWYRADVRWERLADVAGAQEVR